jgi:hypothetical protein
MRIDGSGTELLASGSYTDVLWNSPSTGPAGTLIVSGYGYLDTLQSGSEFSTVGRLDLTTRAFTRYSTGGASPTYSAAAGLVALSSDDGRILVMRADGTGLRAVTSSLISSTTFGPLERPAWSADGQYVLAWSASIGRIVVVRISDGLIVPTSIGGRVVYPSWKP